MVKQHKKELLNDFEKSYIAANKDWHINL
jgi:hypothetical protein